MENTTENKDIQIKLHKLAVDYSVLKVDDVIKTLEEIIKDVKKQKKGVKNG